MFQFAWVLAPNTSDVHKMYPFSDQLITVQAYIDYFLRDMSYLILIYLMAKFVPGFSSELGFFFWLWLGYVFEYMLCYNEPFSYFGPIPISYSLFAGLAMIVVIAINIKNHFKHDNT